MKKFLILIPAGLLATTGLLWMNANYSISPKITSASIEALPKNSVELFTFNEHSVRQIVRYGDKKEISSFKTSLNALDSELLKYRQLGLETDTTKRMISQYKEDTTNLTQIASLYSKELYNYSNVEKNTKKTFHLSLEQIGLYELKKSLINLDKTRLDYIKEPSPTTQKEYEEISKNMKNIINELYLDTAIEMPLFAYIDNHNHYFQTIVSIYSETGLERINRLQENSYAIKAELQLLPKI